MMASISTIYQTMRTNPSAKSAEGTFRVFTPGANSHACIKGQMALNLSDSLCGPLDTAASPNTTGSVGTNVSQTEQSVDVAQSVWRSVIDDLDDELFRQYVVGSIDGPIGCNEIMSHDMITNPSAARAKADGLCRVATANVCTLRPKEISTAVMEGRNISAVARVSILERDFHSA